LDDEEEDDEEKAEAAKVAGDDDGDDASEGKKKNADVVEGPVLGLGDPHVTNIRLKELENVMSENKSFLLFLMESKCADLLERSIIPATSHNFKDLCKNKPGEGFGNTRRMCLFVESESAQLKDGGAQLLKDLAESKEHYMKDLLENQSEEEGEQETRIQLIEYTESAGVLSKKWAVNTELKELFGKKELQDADIVLFEADFDRALGLKLKNFKPTELHSAVAFEDLHLHDGFPNVQDGVPIVRHSLSRAFYDTLFGRNWLEFLISYIVFFAPFLAIAVELCSTNQRASRQLRRIPLIGRKMFGVQGRFVTSAIILAVGTIAGVIVRSYVVRKLILSMFYSLAGMLL
jgi:hypothetical protein